MKTSDYEAVSSRVSDLKKHFVKTERYFELEQQFQLLLSRHVVGHGNGGAFEGRGIAIVGASGSGKTTAVERLLRHARDMYPDNTETGEVIAVSMRVPSPATLKFVGMTALKALGYPMERRGEAYMIWEKVKFHLRERHVRFLHLDEAQDVAARGTEKDRRAVVNTLKSLMQDQDWPVNLILTGTNDLTDILNFDPQLGRRLNAIEFNRLEPQRDVANIRKLVKSYGMKANVSVDGHVLSDAFAARIIHAADCEFGLCVELIIAAMEDLFLNGASVLGADVFASAYQRRTGCIPGLNPFLVEDFQSIDPRKLLGRLEAF